MTPRNSLVVCLSFMIVAQIFNPMFLHAADRTCVFTTSISSGKYLFNVISMPAETCDVQLLRIAVQRSGTPLTNFIDESDMLAENARVEDLDGDGAPELLITSRSQKSAPKLRLDLFYLEEGKMYRLILPDVPPISGYRGGDELSFADRKIVRAFRLFRAGDKECCPTGPNKIVTYEYRNKQFFSVPELPLSTNKYAEPVATNTKSRKSDADQPPFSSSSKSKRLESTTEHTQTAAEGHVAAAEEQPDPQQSELNAVVRPIHKQSGKSGAARSSTAKRRVVKGIAVKEDYLEIQADGAIESYRTLRLSKPWRLIIDIPDARSSIPAASVAVGKFGIEKARIGLHDGFLRIVLDSSLLSLPVLDITKGEDSLRINLVVSEDK